MQSGHPKSKVAFAKCEVDTLNKKSRLQNAKWNPDVVNRRCVVQNGIMICKMVVSLIDGQLNTQIFYPSFRAFARNAYFPKTRAHCSYIPPGKSQSNCLAQTIKSPKNYPQKGCI